MKPHQLHLTRWLMTAFVLLALSACSQDEEPASVQTPVRLQVKAGIAEREVADTRAVFDDDGSGNFQSGDEIIVTRQNDGLSIAYRYYSEWGNTYWEPYLSPNLDYSSCSEEEFEMISEGFIMHSYEETYTAYYANPENPEDPLMAITTATMDRPEVNFHFEHLCAKINITFEECAGCSYSIVGLGEKYEESTVVDDNNNPITVYANPSNVSSFAIDLTSYYGDSVKRYIVSLANVKANTLYTYTVRPNA
jgi:hypothetical protein